MRRLTLFPALLLLITLAISAAQRPADAASTLAGEHFTVTNFQLAGTCNPSGPSTFTFLARGVASGNYPGQFSESGSFTITNGTSITAFTASFDILDNNSILIVSGTKTLRAQSNEACTPGTTHSVNLIEVDLTYQTTFGPADTGFARVSLTGPVGTLGTMSQDFLLSTAPTPTNTPVPPTNTPTDTPTNTPFVPTNTPTDIPTNTPVPPTNTPTDIPTNTPVPPTNTPTDTPTNTPTDTPEFGTVVIEKRAESETGDLLTGACFRLDGEGAAPDYAERCDATDGLDGKTTFSLVAPGTYTVIETEVPVGYAGGTVPPITVDPGETENVVIVNQPLPPPTATPAPLTIRGFAHPVDNPPVVNIAKAGSTIPLKFEVFAGATELTSTSVVTGIAAATTACGGGGTATDAIEVVATGGTSLRYDSTAGQFVYNWKLPKSAAGTCVTVTVTFADESELTALFQLT